jgi:hypothetical protein
MAVKFESLPALPLAGTQDAGACLSGLLVEQVVGVREPQVKRILFHVCVSWRDDVSFNK